MLHPSNRAIGFTDSVIRRMTRVLPQRGAVNLSQGFPDFDLLANLAKVAKSGPRQYSVARGTRNLRGALARKQSRLMGRETAPDEEIGRAHV
jgi:aminotransferase